jgi:Spy/CpxP family protein refolding chaperone
VQALNLTDAQKDKFASVGKSLRATVGDEVVQIQGVLTSGQQEKLQELSGERKEQVRDRMAHRIANLQDLSLTAEQKTQIASIRQEYRPRIQEAGNHLRAAVRNELQQISEVVKG